MQRRHFVYEYITGYLKNRWAKHKLVCIHFDAFSTLISNMGTKLYSSEFLTIYEKNEGFICNLYSHVNTEERSMQVVPMCVVRKE